MSLARLSLTLCFVVLLAASSGVTVAGESATPSPTWPLGEKLPSIYEAIEVRDGFGLRADPEYVAGSLGDSAAFPYLWENLPLTSEERADMIARLDVQRRLTSGAVGYASGRPGFLEAYIDQRRGGIPVFLFDEPVDEVREGIAFFLPGIEFEVHQVDPRSRRLSRLKRDISRARKDLTKDGIEVTSVSVDVANGRVEVGVAEATDEAETRLAELGGPLLVVERPSLVAITLLPSPFGSLWKPLDPGDLDLRYYCDATPFTAAELAAAVPADEAEPSLRDSIQRHGRSLLEGDADWHVVKRGEGRVLALTIDDRRIDFMELERWKTETFFAETWGFMRGGSCEPQAAFGRGLGGEWWLDPRYRTPGPKARKLHVIGDAGCNGTVRRGRARISYTEDTALVAIPMGSKVHSDMCHGLEPQRMIITLPKPLGDRDLFDTGSLPIRRVKVGADSTRESE